MIRPTIYYATRSEYKKEEFAEVLKFGTFLDASGRRKAIGEQYRFEFSEVKTDEPLEIDLVEMVRHKARSAYRALLMPCIVEHAGLILEQHGDKGFPGGLTQPMWDALGAEEFLRRTGASGEKAVARAVVGFCDGMNVYTFVGETRGVIAGEPRGNTHQFYWDTIFSPSAAKVRTYAEIVESDGLRKKLMMSQSYKAIRKFASYLSTNEIHLFDL